MSAADAAAPSSAAEAKTLFEPLADASALVLAVSGGPDSTALLVLAARWRAARKTGPQLLAVTIDHGLRPESRARRARSSVWRAGSACRIARCAGAAQADDRLAGGARAARYRLLAAAAGARRRAHILTAHTLDDQAETVLIRMSRGSGLSGLGAMARATPLPVGGDARAGAPAARASESAADCHAARAGIEFADDPSNRDPRFTRARLRELMPALAREGLDARRLALLARRLRRAEAAIEAAVDVAVAALSRAAVAGCAGRSCSMPKGSHRLPAEIALRLLGRAIARTGDEGPVELGKLEALYEALRHAKAPARPRACAAPWPAPWSRCAERSLRSSARRPGAHGPRAVQPVRLTEARQDGAMPPPEAPQDGKRN